MGTQTGVDPAQVESYDRDGFLVVERVIPDDVVEAALAGVDRVVAGEYVTGRPPRLREWSPDDGAERLVKIAEPHRCEPSIAELVRHPAVGAWAAAVARAATIQVWAVDLFIKHPTRAHTTNVGWHQDGSYAKYWRGAPFTVWIPLSDVTREQAPLRYVRGSHHLGLIDGGDFYETDLERVQHRLTLPDGFVWDEVAVPMGRGSLAFHHHLTLHGSGRNSGTARRVAIALRLRTEDCHLVQPDQPAPAVAHLDDPDDAPTLYGPPAPYRAPA